MRYLYFSLFVFIFCGCKDIYSDNAVFNGTIHIVKDMSITKSVTFNEISFDGINYGYLSVCDSLAIFMNPKLSDYIYDMFNINTQEEIGKYVRKGRGSNEYISLAPIYNFFMENENMKTLLFEGYKETAMLWNISKTIKGDSLYIEKTMRLPWRKENKGACFNELFMENSHKLYAKVSSSFKEEEDTSLPYYQIWDLDNMTIQREIQIYKRPIINRNTDILNENLLYSHDAMKPDGSKIVQAMMHLPQINIIDTRTGNIVAYRLNEDMTFSDLGHKQTFKSHFIRVHADDNYIYTLYWGKDDWDPRTVPLIDNILIFDWNGNLKYRLQTNHGIDAIYADNIRKKLYTTSPFSDNVFCISVDEDL